MFLFTKDSLLQTKFIFRTVLSSQQNVAKIIKCPYIIYSSSLNAFVSMPLGTIPLVTADKHTLVHPCFRKTTVHIRVQSQCCTFYGLGVVWQHTFLLQYPTENSFTVLDSLCVLSIHCPLLHSLCNLWMLNHFPCFDFPECSYN